MLTLNPNGFSTIMSDNIYTKLFLVLPTNSREIILYTNPYKRWNIASKSFSELGRASSLLTHTSNPPVFSVDSDLLSQLMLNFY